MSEKTVRLDFERNLIVVKIQNLIPLKPLRHTIKDSRKYKQIVASIRAVGLVEPPAILRDPQKKGLFLILDGHLRVEALKDLGLEEVECLIATEDDTYTYNRRLNRLSATQEHRMICRAVDRGVPEDILARALGFEVSTIRRRFKMLDGICDAAVEILRDTPCTMSAFDILKRMLPPRQVEVAQMMVDRGDFSTRAAKFGLDATSNKDLILPKKSRTEDDPSATNSTSRMASLERDLARVQGNAKTCEDEYAANNLHLTIAKSYLEKLLSSPRVKRWLAQNEPDYLEQFQKIASLTSIQRPDLAAE